MIGEPTKLCLIDDNIGDYRLLLELLSNDHPENYRITHFQNLADGVENLSKNQFDVLLLDLFLPDSDGLDTLNTILNNDVDIPIIVLTGLEDESFALTALKSGAQDYLVKGEFESKLISRSIAYAIERFRLNKRLMHMTITDDLTGLNNRRGFIALAEHQINSAKRTGTDLLVLFIDVDGLKLINDRYGHHIGDRTLVATAEILRTTFRESDILARIGGDEFAVLAVASRENNRVSIWERLDSKRKQFLANINESYDLSFSVGISEWKPDDPKNLDVLMNEADAAMYAQKLEKKGEFILPAYAEDFVDLEFDLLATSLNADVSEKSAITNLLLIEDNPADARLVQEILNDCQLTHQLEHVTHISKAKSRLGEKHFDVILLDLSLPDSHGIQTLDTMLKAAPDVPIVVMTGIDDRELAMQALQKGAQDYLTKGSYDEDLLERSIQYAIERHHLNLQNLRYARELKLSESRFRRISDENVDGILILDFQQRVLFCNPAAEELFSITMGKKLLGKTVDLPVGIRDSHQITLRDDEAAPVHLEIRQAKIPWRGASAYLTSVRDVTTLVLAQDAISRQTEDLGLINTINDALNHGVELKDVIKILQDGTMRVLSAHNATIYLLDPNNEYLTPVSIDHLSEIIRDIENLVGFSLPEIKIPVLPGSMALEFRESEDPILIENKDDICRWMLGFLHAPDISEEEISQVQKFLPGIFENIGIEAMIMAPLIADGDVFGLLDISTKEKFTRSDTWRVATIAKQISMAISRKIAEEHMRLQAAALDAAANAIVITDRDGKINWTNPAFTNLTGYTFEEVAGENLRILKSGHHQTVFYQQLWDTIVDGRVWFGEMVNQRKNGDLYYEDMTIAPLTDDTGEVSHFIAVKQDISQRKSAEGILQRQLDELAILHSVAVVCVEETDQDLLLEKVTDICSGTLYPEHFGVLLLDEDEQVLVIHASFRGLPAGYPHQTIKLSEGIVGSVARSAQSRRVADVGQVDEYIFATNGLQSALSVPLKVGERVLGVLHSESTKNDAFSEDDERLISTIAGQLAIALEKIRQQEAEREQRIRAEASRDTAVALNSSLAFDQILDQILNILVRLIPHEASVILLNENGHARVTRCRNYRQGADTNWIHDHVFQISETRNLNFMLETGEPLRIPDITKYDGWIPQPGSEWISSQIGVPITKDSRAFGFLSLHHSQAKFFTKEHEQSLQVLANQLAIALENANLYEEAEQRASELARLYNASGVLLASASEEIRKSGQTIVDMLRSEFGQSNCSLLLVGEDNRKLERVAASGPYTTSVFGGQELLLDGPGIAPSSIREKHIVNVPDVTKRDDYVPNWKDARSEMAVPLIVGDKTIGVIDIQSAQKNAFNENDERVVSVFAERAALSLENSQLYQHQHRQLAFLESLHQIDLAISGSMNLNVTLDVIARQVISQLKVDALSILVLDMPTLMLDPIAMIGFSVPVNRNIGLRFGEGLGGKAAQQGKIVHMTCEGDNCDDCIRMDVFKSEGFHSYYGIPLMSKGQVKGVLELFHRRAFVPDSQWISFAETVATQAAIAIDNAQLLKELERSNMDLSLAYDATLEGWAKALELRDHETVGHSRRVVKMAMELSKKLGFEGADLVHIRRGALLHDIGKMGVPDSILQKAGPLDDDEWEIMRQHPVYAYEWLRSTKYLQPALDIPHFHHEKWDGSGYPEGLKGEEIPMPARIFAIIDVWDALRSDRPYRKAWSEEKAVSFIKEQKGNHFDPQVVDAFLEMVQDNRLER